MDLAGVDVARENLGDRWDLCLAQADIMDLPLRPRSFDIVFCHRVLQHTPDPAKTLRHILSFVKDQGAVFVHSYARTIVQMCRWKYALRPITKRMNPESLYRIIEGYSKLAFRLTNLTARVPGGIYFNYFAVPFANKRHKPKFANLSDDEITAYGVHDTFDALSPRYDNPLSPATFDRTAEEMLRRSYEIERGRTVTLLRTLVE